MIDAKHPEAACRRLCVGVRAAGGVDDGGERNPFADITTTDGADLEFPDEISDEPFHGVTSLLDRRVLDDLIFAKKGSTLTTPVQARGV